MRAGDVQAVAIIGLCTCFEDADTAVSAAVCLYGHYGERDASPGRPSSPQAYLGRDAPPFLIAHGENDPLIEVSHVDDFVHALRSVSARARGECRRCPSPPDHNSPTQGGPIRWAL